MPIWQQTTEEVANFIRGKATIHAAITNKRLAQGGLSTIRTSLLKFSEYARLVIYPKKPAHLNEFYR